MDKELVEVLETLAAIMFTFLRNCASAGAPLNKPHKNEMQRGKEKKLGETK